MKLFSIAIYCCFIATLISAKDYTNYKVYDVTPNKNQLHDLMEWQDNVGVDFWITGGIARSSRIMVSPDVEKSFIHFLENTKIEHNLVIDNVESKLKADKSARLNKRAKRSVFAENGEPNFGLYWTFPEMEEYTIRLAEQYPNLVKRDIIGKTIEGRDMIALRISSGSEFGKNPIIFIDAGIHAREWVGPAVVNFLIYQLVTNATYTQELVSKVDWVIIPNANPDGYVYSYTEDRLWRKNRRYVNYTCTGVDLNRNFAYVWKQGSTNSCPTLSYPGEHALSEPEVYAIASYMDSFKFNLRMYLSTHSYGDLVLWPFGFDFNVYIKNWKEHTLVGELWKNAIYKATGKSYRVGNSADILYTANGASDDHAAAHGNANLAFTLELTNGGSGFEFPQDMVEDLVHETFLGYREFGLYIGENYNYN